MKAFRKHKRGATLSLSTQSLSQLASSLQPFFPPAEFPPFDTTLLRTNSIEFPANGLVTARLRLTVPNVLTLDNGSGGPLTLELPAGSAITASDVTAETVNAVDVQSTTVTATDAVNTDVLASNGANNITVRNSLLLPTADGVPSPFNFYQTTTFPFNWKGAYATPVSATIYITRIGNFVQLYVPAFKDKADHNAILESDEVLPEIFRPITTTSLFYLIVVLDNGNQMQGSIYVDTTGLITLGQGIQAAPFTMGGNAGIPNDISFGYLTAS